MTLFPDRRAALSAMLAALAPNAFGQTAQRRWTITGTANTNSSGPQNPYYALGNEAVQALVLAALDGPLPRAEVERRLRGTDISLQNLLDTDVLLRNSGGRYALAFNVVAREDMQLSRRVADPAGALLAEAILAERAAFERAFGRYDLPHVDPKVLAMALVGCVVLDWDGLDVTAEDGLRAPPVLKANGDKYLMSMIESAPDISVRGLYWGSHNENTTDGTAVLTTFGDHEAPDRLGFPDIQSRVSGADLASQAPQAVARRLAAILYSGLSTEQDEAGRIMLQLREGPASAGDLGGTANTLRLLESLFYVRQIEGRYHAHAPVLTARDRQMLDEVRTLGRRIMRDWLRQNYEQVREQLSDLRAVRAGVSFDIVFTQIWHDLFGWANYHLVRTGFLYDPYGPDAEWVGFAPFVWARELNLYAGTRIF